MCVDCRYIAMQHRLSIWLGLYNVHPWWRNDRIEKEKKNAPMHPTGRKCVKDVKHHNLYCNRFEMHSLQRHFLTFPQIRSNVMKHYFEMVHQRAETPKIIGTWLLKKINTNFLRFCFLRRKNPYKNMQTQTQQNQRKTLRYQDLTIQNINGWNGWKFELFYFVIMFLSSLERFTICLKR